MGPQWKPSEAAFIGRGRAAKGTSLAPPGKASDLELARTRLAVLRRGDFKGEREIEIPLPFDGSLVNFTPPKPFVSAV